MNKNITIISILLLGTFFLSGCTLFNKKTEVLKTPVSNDEAQNESIMEPETKKMAQIEAPEGSKFYTINEQSSVSYQVNKKFFNKPSILVKGTTNNVVGSGWADFTNQNFNLEANIDLLSLTTDSSKRDSDIAGLFGNGAATVKLIKIATPVNEGEEFNTTATLEITVNEMTQQSDFEVTGKFTEAGLEIQGTGNAKISEFGIKAPSADGVFEVLDDLELSFIIKSDAQKQGSTGDSMMEEENTEKKMLDAQ